MTTPPTPTDQWRAAAPTLPPLSPAADVAERLLLLVHYSIDWSTSWVAAYVPRYWDHHLPVQIRSATNRAADLGAWWSMLARAFGFTSTHPDRRMETVTLLAYPADDVLDVLRDHDAMLILRVRIIADAVSAARTTGRDAP